MNTDGDSAAVAEVTPRDTEQTEITDEQERALLEAVAEADRDEVVPWEEVRGMLRGR